jgi:hypothetical protein
MKNERAAAEFETQGKLYKRAEEEPEAAPGRAVGVVK